MNEISIEERRAKALEDWKIAGARVKCDYNDESKRKGFMQKAGDELGKPFNELTGDEIDAYCEAHDETIEVPTETNTKEK